MINWDKFKDQLTADNEYENYFFINQWIAVYESDGFINVVVSEEYTVSEGVIPATDERLELLIKAFMP